LILERFNAYRSCIGKIARKTYLRRYPVTIMKPDGSTIEIRLDEPLHFVQQPIDLKLLTKEERRVRLAARKPKVKVIEEVISIFCTFSCQSLIILFKYYFKGKEIVKIGFRNS
uniref:39S ribosomal protein L55, mitochondrial n=1 Tax=Dracunculus medinensis TaxID=318479 RepID=A0A0N4U7G0_DRAME